MWRKWSLRALSSEKRKHPEALVCPTKFLRILTCTPSTIQTTKHNLQCAHHNILTLFQNHVSFFRLSLAGVSLHFETSTSLLYFATLTDRRSLTPTAQQFSNTSANNDEIMADSLNMNGLSLTDSQHAPQPGAAQQNGFPERAAYIPPHMRQRAAPPSSGPNGYDGGPAPMSNGLNSSAWAPQR